MIPAIIFNDDGLKAGKTAMWAYGSGVTADVGDLTGFFHDDMPEMLNYTATVNTQADGGLETMVSVMESDTSGMFTVTLKSGDLSGTDDETLTNGMSYANSVVEVMATDQEDLWASQMFYVRRNRAPVIRTAGEVTDTSQQDLGLYGTTVVVGTAGDHKTLEIDTGDVFFFDDDQLTVTAEVDDPMYASVTVMGDVITLTGLMGTEGDPVTSILLRAMDTGGLSTKQHTVVLEVDTGPAMKTQPDDLSYPLEQALAATEVYVVDVERFFTLPTTGGETITYTAESDNRSVATVTATLAAETDQGGAGVDLAIQLESLGSTEITLTATEAEAGTNPRSDTAMYGDPIQKASVKFMVTVVAE